MQPGGKATVAIERVEPGSGGAALAGDRIAQFLEAGRAGHHPRLYDLPRAMFAEGQRYRLSDNTWIRTVEYHGERTEK